MTSLVRQRGADDWRWIPCIHNLLFHFLPAVNKNKQRSEEIKQALDDRRKGRGGSTEQQAIKTKLAELRSQFQTLLVRW